MNISCEQFGPVSGIVLFPPGLPQSLPNIPSPYQQLIKPPIHIHSHQLPLPPDIPDVPICIRLKYLELIDVGVDLGSKCGPCILQFFVYPLPGGPIIPPPNTLYLLPCVLYTKYQLPPSPLSISPQNIAFLCLLIS